MPGDNSGRPLINAADSEIADSNRDLVAEAYLAGSVDVVVRQVFDTVLNAFGVTASEEVIAALDEMDGAVAASIGEMLADPTMLAGARARLRALGVGE
ncbi:hypothetical protein [Nocardia tengchongensis]|uniref:hypothetical protein n=1 Tax=Nocardia tengchongensis TaxID=2055889 RepID=UPI0036083DFE